MYDQETGLWNLLSSQALLNIISARLLAFSREFKVPDLAAKRTATLCRDIRCFMDGAPFDPEVFTKRKRNLIHVGNGMIEIMTDGQIEFKSFAPEYYSCSRSTVNYDPQAQCPRFLEKLLRPCMEQEDIDIIQLYGAQCLLGVNLSQTFLMLTGTPGAGKSALVNVIEGIVSRSNCTELRLEQMCERFEINRLIGKTLLTAKDVKSYFLSTKGAYKLKALTGRDTITAEAKGSNDAFDVNGEFNVIITANSNLAVDIDSDNQAWRRRMLWVRYECPPVAERIDAFDEVLLREEASGILNWLIEGARKLILSNGRIPHSGKQLKRIDDLLMESDSVHAFVETCLVQEPGCSITMLELYSAYERFCCNRDWQALPHQKAKRQLRSGIESKFHITQRNDLRSGSYDSISRGYGGIAISKTE